MQAHRNSGAEYSESRFSRFKKQRSKKTKDINGVSIKSEEDKDFLVIKMEQRLVPVTRNQMLGLAEPHCLLHRLASRDGEDFSSSFSMFG